MTIIQPDRANLLWNRILIGLAVFLLLAAVYLVWLYTRLVNLDHNLTQTKTEIQNLQTENSEFKDKIFTLFNESQLQTFATAHQLVLDRKPQYLTVNQTWFPDSQP